MLCAIALIRLRNRGDGGLHAAQIFEVLRIYRRLAISLDAVRIFPLPAFAMSIGKRKICSPAVAMLRAVLPEIGGFTVEQKDAVLNRCVVFIRQNENDRT